MTAAALRVIAGNAADLPQGYVERLGRYRHQVFIEQLGWAVESERG